MTLSDDLSKLEELRASGGALTDRRVPAREGAALERW